MPYDEVCPPNFVKSAPPRARPQYKSSSNDTVVCEYWNTWGSAHNETELAALMETGRKKLHEGQLELDLGLDT